MSDFKAQLEKIQTEFIQEEHRTENEFNIFNALYRKDNERLHSRFISYLLSSDSRHGMGKKFLYAFKEILSEQDNGDILNKFDFSNCIVRPNEKEKEEHEKIDILISNDNQAIVIENKIFANPSYHYVDGKRHQIDTYCQKMKEGTKKEKGEQGEEGRKDVFAIYLALNKRNPKEEGIIHKPIIVIDYQEEITHWINKCIDITKESSIEEKDKYLLAEILEQYRSVIKSLTSNLPRVKKIKDILDIDENIKKVWEVKEIRNFMLNMGDFRHVKWLTINSFWLELSQQLRDKLQVEISKEINIKDITKVAHDKKGSTGINFRLDNGEEWYIVNDNKNGLSYGINKKDKKNDDWHYINKNINFTNFSNEDTFMLINAEKREDKIKEIINRLKENPLIMKSKES